jgi:ABC-type amino acid transport substrate-binding protein
MRSLMALLLLMTASAYLGAQRSVELFVGEQPPLISEGGGIVDRVVVASLAAAGYDARLTWLPIGRMLLLLKENSLEPYITASNTPGQQNPHVDLLEARGVFFYKKARFPDFQAKRLEDLAGYRVATVLNSPNTPLFRKAGLIVEEGPNDTWFEKLDMGRVDFTATADVGGLITIKREFPGRESEFAFTSFAYTTIGAGLYAKDDPELLAAVRKGFVSMRSDGSLERMLKEFFGQENWRLVRVAF